MQSHNILEKCQVAEILDSIQMTNKFGEKSLQLDHLAGAASQANLAGESSTLSRSEEDLYKSGYCWGGANFPALLNGRSNYEMDTSQINGEMYLSI